MFCLHFMGKQSEAQRGYLGRWLQDGDRPEDLLLASQPVPTPPPLEGSSCFVRVWGSDGGEYALQLPVSLSPQRRGGPGSGH